MAERVNGKDSEAGLQLTHLEVVDIGDVDNIQDQVLREDDEGTHIIQQYPLK